MRRALVSFLVVTMTIGSAPHAPAQPQAGSVLLIMDASGSMNRLDDAGVPLIDGAKGALRQIVHRLPPDANVGLRVYGHRTSNDDPVAGCVDTELVVPVGPIDREALTAAIDSFDASGFTPIGLSLQEAAEDLAAVGSGTIILVSDGVDTCAPPDPCEVAEQLATEGFATQIHTVGFFLNDQAAVNQLQCIADAGNGTFTSVDSIDNFFEQLSGLVTEALEGPGRISPRVQGALVMELAPVLPWIRYSPGWALETDGEGTIGTGETRWFAFDVGDDRVPFGHLYVTARINWQVEAGPDEYLEVRIFDEGGVEVGVPHEVLGVVVEAPQRLYLSDAASWVSSDSSPAATAVTGPRNAFPSWEFEPWFAPTRERFYAEQMNGGVYQLWKSVVDDPPLPAGRYYAAVTWSADRTATSVLGINVTLYPGKRLGDLWIRDEPQTFLFNEDGRDPGRPTQLEMIEWTGALPDSAEQPLRSIEVMSMIELDEPRYFRFHLDQGERLFIGYRISCAATGQCANLRELVVTHEAGIRRASPIEPRNAPNYDEFARGYEEAAAAFRAPVAGQYTLEVELRDPRGSEPAILLAVFVYPPEEGVYSSEEGAYLPEDGWPSLPRPVWLSFMAGLSSVRQAVE